MSTPTSVKIDKNMSTRRALHWVFKVGNRTQTATFYRDVIGMKVLRHEEFEEGCHATCNGPYDGKWSKSMLGYGPEHNHFVVELTYNYDIGSYTVGNDFLGITIRSKKVLENAKMLGWSVKNHNNIKFVEAPGGYRFYITETDCENDPVQKISLASSNLPRTLSYWQGKCGMKVFHRDDHSLLLGYSENQCHLEFIATSEPIDHATGSGRIAFSCPTSELPIIESSMKDSGETILTSLISLDTPGKATVSVVILADPDGYEICFVGEEGFAELSQVDPNADRLLNEAITADHSDTWFSKKGRSKVTA